MLSIEQIEQQIESEIRIDERGRGTASIKAVSRLAGVNDAALIRTFQGADLKPSKLAKTLIANGFDAADLKSFSESGIPDIAIAIILKYYAYQAGRYCTQQAKAIDGVLSAITVRKWMQQIKGWQEPRPQVEPQLQLPPQQELQVQPQSMPLPETPIQLIVEMAKHLARQEQEQLELKRQQQELNQRLTAFEQVQVEARQELIALPPASTGVPEESLDMKVRRIVNNYCSATGLMQGEVFRNLYQQFSYRYRRQVKPQGSESKLQAFVRLGLIGNLYDLAAELLMPSKSVVQFQRRS